MINFNLSEEQRINTENSKRICKKRINSKELLKEMNNKIWPTEQIKKMADFRIFRYDGKSKMAMAVEWTLISYSIAMEEIAASRCFSFSNVMSVNNSLVCYLIEHFGSDNSQKEKYLKKLAIWRKV